MELTIIIIVACPNGCYVPTSGAFNALGSLKSSSHVLLFDPDASTRFKVLYALIHETPTGVPQMHTMTNDFKD